MRCLRPQRALCSLGGTDRSDEAHDVAFGDTWLFDGEWHDLGLAPPRAPGMRWGHGLACQPPRWLDPSAGFEESSCMIFGGAALSEDDHFQDTWIFKAGGWKQTQPGTWAPGPRPAGRCSFQIASSGAGTLLSGGSIGYRICGNDTWTFNFTHSPSIWTTDKVNHDTEREWLRQHAESSPGFLGGASMARVDGALRGVINFGGVSFNPGIGPAVPGELKTWLWPESACPGVAAPSAMLV